MPYIHWFINYIWPHIHVQPSSSAQIERVQWNKLFYISSMVKLSTICSLKLDRYCMFAGYIGWHSPKVFSYSIAKTITWKSNHSVYVKRLMLNSGSNYTFQITHVAILSATWTCIDILYHSYFPVECSVVHSRFPLVLVAVWYLQRLICCTVTDRIVTGRLSQQIVIILFRTLSNSLCSKKY